MFRPSYIINADYSAIEVRIMAILDPKELTMSKKTKTIRNMRAFMRSYLATPNVVKIKTVMADAFRNASAKAA